MAIGMGAALLGSAVIGAGASAIGASKNSKAINKSTNAQVQANRDSLEVQQDIYNQNKNVLAPYVNRGNAAGDAINALLGLGGTSSASPSAPSATTDWGAYAAANPDVAREFQTNVLGRGAFSNLNDYAKYHYENYGRAEGRLLPGATTTATVEAPVNATQAAENAFKAYQDSTGYNFRVTQGMDALNSGYAGKGLLNSGAAQKAALQFGQDIGSAEFGNYLGYLGTQQGVGLSGANALAGVGTNYANGVTAGNAATANAIGSGAMAKAANTNNFLANLTSSFGTAAGALSSFGGAGAYGIAGSGGIY